MIALVFFCVLAATHGQNNVQVNTAEGIIVGYPATDGNYYTFHGIPYAMSRTGSDMFKPSTPPSALPGILYAFDSGIECAHPGPNGMIGIVNCLVLNVFTGNVNASKSVLVWLNGEESNSSISAQYSFRKLIEEDVVVVTLNYRLSVYGFLCLKTEDHPGNAGLKDIILGLQWIQRNIASFGGNPNNVVLMGHGSAAAMVDLITLTAKSENLIHKAITLSGSAVAPWAVSYDPIGSAMTLMSHFGFGLQAIDDITIILSSSTLNDVNTALNQFSYTNNTQMFAPCIEDTNIGDAVLTDAPLNLLRAGYYRHIPYIAVYMTREGTQRAEQAVTAGWLEKMQANFTDFLPADLDLGENETSVAQNIRNFYFNNGPINMTSIENYLHYHGDTMVVLPTIRGVRERAATSISEVRLLEFGYMGTNNSDWNLDQIPLNGVRHGGILNYLFNFDLNPSDEIVADSIIKRITTFFHLGFPFNTNTPDWPAITNQSFPYLYYGGSSEVQQHVETIQHDPQQDKMIFWDALYDLYYNSPSPSSASRLIGLLSVVLFSVFVVAMI